MGKAPVDTGAHSRSLGGTPFPMKLRPALGFAISCLLAGAAVGADQASKKDKAPNPVFAAVTDTPGLPRVLLIGDSISMGYTLPVRATLAGRANVHRPPENCGDTARGVQSLEKWLGSGKWDVIHFNFGLHDLKYVNEKGALAGPDQGGKQVASLADYEKNLRAIVARLKRTGAKLVWAATTPVPAGSTGRIEHDELRYNEVAARVMRELGVAINDLHAFVPPQQAKLQRPQNVHFTDAGSAALAAQVVATIQPLLPAGAR